MTIGRHPAPLEAHRQKLAELEIHDSVNIILKGLPDTCEPISILWHGSRARSEAGMYQFKDRWLPYGGYHLEVVCDQLPKADIIDHIEQNFLNQFGYRTRQSSIGQALNEDNKVLKVVDF